MTPSGMSIDQKRKRKKTEIIENVRKQKNTSPINHFQSNKMYIHFQALLGPEYLSFLIGRTNFVCHRRKCSVPRILYSLSFHFVQN